MIVQCNQSIDKLTELKELDPSNEYFDIYKAEVRGIRAMYYYYLLDMFARVPIVESSLTQMKDVKQSERSEVFNFVKKELEESIPLLADEKSADQGEYYGRMTKAAAYFLMAKLALNAEVYTDNDWTDQSRLMERILNLQWMAQKKIAGKLPSLIVIKLRSVDIL